GPPPAPGPHRRRRSRRDPRPGEPGQGHQRRSGPDRQRPQLQPGDVHRRLRPGPPAVRPAAGGQGARLPPAPPHPPHTAPPPRGDVGLDYLALGQPAPTLSGGEAQRVKLAAELARPNTGRTLYLLDEPTTGLHFDDIHKLLEVLNRLVDLGNTVIVVEHNLDVIKTADWVIDLGPEAGDAGGRVVAAGTPEEVARVPESHTGAILNDVLDAGAAA